MAGLALDVNGSGNDELIQVIVHALTAILGGVPIGGYGRSRAWRCGVFGFCGGLLLLVPFLRVGVWLRYTIDQNKTAGSHAGSKMLRRRV
jgi:hypothetical protein